MSEGNIQLLFPSLEVGVSLNGHLEQFLLGPRVYINMVQEEEVDAFDFTEIWLYISKHIHEYLLDIVEDTGPINTDSARLVSLGISLFSDPSTLEAVVDCEDCNEGYREQIRQYVTQTDDEDDDDD